MTINTELNSNLIFVNSNIDDYQGLTSNLNNAELVILDSTRDGVEQISEALSNYSQVDSIHILSHGQSGTLQLGSTELSADNLDNYASDLQSWSSSFSEDGDIILYGCSIGAGSTGFDFVTNLGELTNADIAASDDLTGSSYLGGDWDLEITTGEIEAKTIDAADASNYDYILPISDNGQKTLIDYSDFSDVSQLQLNGNATQAGDALRLTPAERGQRGSSFYQQALIVDADTSFSSEFQFQLSGGTNGADGFIFMLQNDESELSALGRSGARLGYNGVSQSLAIEFDSYLNRQFDSDGNHVSILTDGNYRTPLATATAPLDLNSGEVLNAWVDYDGELDLLEVYLSNTVDKPETSLLSYNIDLAEVVGEQAFLGFSAATGGGVNNHDILDWEFASNSSLLSDSDEAGLNSDEAGLNSIVDYNNFADVSQLKLNGDATQAEGTLRITANERHQQGSVFYDEPIQVKDDTSFSTQFQFKIDGGTDGASGFSFILQNDRQGDYAIGTSIQQSLAIEFDTFQNVNDPNNNHISILINGDSGDVLVNADSSFDLNGGEILNAWIDYDGSSNQLQVFLSDTATKSQTPTLSVTADLSDIVGDRARIGFGARTGNLANAHQILNWSFASSDKLAPEGNFSDLIDWPLVAVHAGLTPDGKVLTYGLDGNFGSAAARRNSKFAIWDPKQGASESAFTILDMSHPIDSAFCSGMILLPDGQMLIAGGSIQGQRNMGNDLVHLYDYRTGNITMLPEGDDLVEARWYPTMTSLTDGRILFQGGRNADKSSGVFTPEIYTPGEGASLLDGAASSTAYSNEGLQWWYPRSWVAPNGQVFGISGDDMYYLDPNGDGSITFVGEYTEENQGYRNTAVMYDRGKILQVGAEGQNKQATIIDINGETPVLSSGGTANYQRAWADSTVLPDGTVFVSGGSPQDNIPEQIAYAAEIWDPKDNSWTVVDSAGVLRLYHSTSLLLPDATVLTAGGTTLTFDDEALTGEVYRPAYLYDESGNPAERPTLTSDSEVMDWGTSMMATVGDGQEIDRISLVSFGAVTHSFDMGQRFLELDFTQSGNMLMIETPESASIAPPGYYMMFALDKNGVPSEAHIVQITPEGYQVEHAASSETGMDHMDHMAHMAHMNHA